MEPLIIKTPADVLSLIGHTLGFWPQESLVCITLDANRVGATLRVDLPNREGGLRFARTVADYLAHDTSAASMLFAAYTSEPQKPGQPKQHAATIAALTCALVERGMTIRDGLLVGDNTVAPYDGDPQDGLTLPLKATQSSQINAEFVYRGRGQSSLDGMLDASRSWPRHDSPRGKRRQSREVLLSQPEPVMSPTP
jgi:hypothetical protein